LARVIFFSLFSTFIQNLIISDFEDGSLASFVTDICGLLYIGLGFLVGGIGFKVPWKDFAFFPNYLLANYIFMIGPSFGAMLVPAMYFVKHKKLRRTILRELKNIVCTK
jgi:hypothetical protein